MREISLFTLSVILLLFAPAAESQLLDELPLELDDKVIDGTHAMAVVPTIWSAGGKLEGYLPPDGFKARLVDRNHPETELVYPAGTWFLPPPGFYRVWAEGQWWVSPYPHRLSYGGSVEMVVQPDMVPGGKVRVGDLWAGSGHDLLVFSANPAFKKAVPPPVVQRRRPAAEVLEVRTPSGEGPARQAEVALWLDGHRLSGIALAWLANTRPFTDPNGHWVGHNLPPRTLPVLAWSRNLGSEAAAGDLDTLATEIAYPWPSPAVVRAVR